ncbi:MAG TPA: peptidoglycan DD-metalloendopeptidase family protein [Nocardioidaceae bacterium]|nr:peptidoglycan DD-metalloendopeptidase family protein [Nocardioidaceae bacterium]
MASNLWELLVTAGLGWVLSIYPASQPSGALERQLPVTGPVDYGSSHHDYPATDIFARCGAPVVAPVAGVVLEVGRADRWRPSTDRGAARGGRFVSVRGRDGVRYYSSHLSRVRAGVRAGTTVRAGHRLGSVGRSGSARDTPCHVHFGISPVCAGTGQWWIRRGAVRPYRFLNSWRSGGRLSPARAVSDWKDEHGCPRRP